MEWRRLRIRPTIGLVGLLVLALAATASSQAPRRQAASAPEQDRPTFQAAVDVVEVTVSVTDRDRNSVRDLTAEDFEVYEDGDVQPLVTFSYVDVPFVPLSAPASQPSFDVATNRMREGGGRTYLLLLDDLHTHPLRTDEVRGIARLFIENNLAANDLAAIAVTSGIEPSQPLTSNRQRLLEAADRFIGRDLIDAPGLSLSTDDPFAEFAVNPLPGFGVLDRAKEIKARKVRQLLRALEISAEWMAGTDSRRKAVILVSQGLDYDTTDLFGDREALSLLDEMRRAASAVTRHDVTLYAIDPRGLPSADPGPIPTRWLVGETPFSAPILRAKLTLRGLAEETGGFAFINSNQFDEALEDVVAQNSAYYLLGYQAPRDAPDDQLHQIRVRVDRRDVEVRARRSYVHAPTPAAEATDVMTQLERLLDSPAPRSGLRLDLATMPLRGADSTAEVVVAVHLVPQAPPDDRAGAAGDDAAVVIEALDEEGLCWRIDRSMLSCPQSCARRAANAACGCCFGSIWRRAGYVYGPLRSTVAAVPAAVWITSWTFRISGRVHSR